MTGRKVLPGNSSACRHAQVCVVVGVILITGILGQTAQAVDRARFEAAYSEVEEWMFSTDGEVAEITDFVYQKDAATFTFKEGRMLLRRFIEGRPTVAVFVGSGSVSLTAPLYVERQNLAVVTGDSAIQTDFDICHIRFADDLDLELKQAFDFRTGELSAGEFRRIKSNQGDYFFKPLPSHGFDNYFQLLRSVFCRTADGYFWASFGRYVFCFDPALSEEVSLLYNREPSSLEPWRAARFSRKERPPIDSVDWVEVVQPIRTISQQTELELDGADGSVINRGRSTVVIRRERDSSQFASLFLDHRLQVDSAFADGQPVPFHRRKNFEHVGLILPKHYHAGDSFGLTLVYHGRDYFLPYPASLGAEGYPHSLQVDAPGSYNYPLLGPGQVDETNPQRQQFSLMTMAPQRWQEFLAQATGWDTLSTMTSWGSPLNYSWPVANQNSFFREHDKQQMLERALEYYYELLGAPCGPGELWVAPVWKQLGPWTIRRLAGHTGIIRLSRWVSRDDMGGYANQAGWAAVEQWFGDCLGLQSYRETWLKEALPEYLTLMFIEHAEGHKPFDLQLLGHRQTVYGVCDKEEDLPLATGVKNWTAKGIWVIHMLRNLMNAVDSERDKRFGSFLRDVVQAMNSGLFTNGDFQELAERYFGYDLDWFFRHWLYGSGLPEFDVAYSFEETDEGHYVNMKIVTKGVEESFLMPVLIRIDFARGPEVDNTFVAAKFQDYRLGPYEQKPKDVLFNRYLSVLSRDEVKAGH